MFLLVVYIFQFCGGELLDGKKLKHNVQLKGGSFLFYSSFDIILTSHITKSPENVNDIILYGEFSSLTSNHP